MRNYNNNNDWFDGFVAETKGPLSAFVGRILASPDDVQGVMQDAYLKVFLTLRKDRDGGHSPSALLYTTARNLAISRLRHEKVVQYSVTAVAVAEELRGDISSAEHAVSQSQRLNELLMVVNTLPPKCRDVFVLRWIHGLSQRAIGERLGIAESTVEKHLAKGLRFCKSEIQSRAAVAEAESDARLQDKVGAAS